MIDHGDFLTIDPGLSTGIVLAHYDETGYHRDRVWQIGQGTLGLAIWISRNGLVIVDGRLYLDRGAIPLTRLVVERFTPWQHENFKLTLKSVEPLRCEGALLALGFGTHIDWVEPAQQYFMGSSTNPLKIKKQLARKFLEANGLWLTGKDVNQPDANDGISATLHSVSWLRQKKHYPTLHQLFDKEGN